MVEGVKCAAVVLNYNDSENAIKFVDSIVSYQTVDHIIVADNASTDGSYEKLQPISGGKVSVAETGKNGGYGFGNNFGVKLAKEKFGCDIVFICNSDIVVSEECMAALACTIIRSDDIAIASAIQKNGYTGQVIKGTSWDVPKTLDYIRNSLVIYNALVPERTDHYQNPVEFVGCVPGAFLAVHAGRFLSFGGYDEGMFLFCEESVIGARAEEHGYKTALLTQYSYGHYHSVSIKKSIPSEISKYKLILQSRKYYLQHYRNLGKLQLSGLDLLFGYSVLEYRAKLFLKRLITHGKSQSS